MCLGNSITQGNNDYASYRFELWKMLVETGADFEFVGSHNTNFGGQSPAYGTELNGQTFTNYNEGHWGWSADQIAHAVSLLVENALQYAEGPPVARCEVDDGSVSLLLRTPVDRALPPVELELGFELFFRGEQAVTRAAGLGIGLPVARALARMDGGDVTIADDGGDVVTRLTLPRP